MAKAESLTSEPFSRTAKYRGVTYVLRELEISEFDEISDKSVRKQMVDDGTGTGSMVEVERFDSSLQAKLMLAKSLVEPKGVAIAKLPIPVYGALNKLCNEMHFGVEKEEIAAEAEEAKKAAEITSGGDSDAEGEASGN